MLQEDKYSLTQTPPSLENIEKEKTPDPIPSLLTHAHKAFHKGMITVIVSCYLTFSVLTQLGHRRSASQSKALNLRSLFKCNNWKTLCLFLVRLETFLTQLRPFLHFSPSQ